MTRRSGSVDVHQRPQSSPCPRTARHEAVACVHSFLETRGLHMGALLVVSCIAKHLEVPIVSLESLVRFFGTEEQPVSAEDVQTYELIRRWLVKCIQRNRVCPKNPGPMNALSNVSRSTSRATATPRACPPPTRTRCCG